jgi:hypothetical protein
MSLSHLEAAFKADIPMKHKLTLVMLIMGGVKHSSNDCELMPDLTEEALCESLEFLLKHGFIEQVAGGARPRYERKHYKLKVNGHYQLKIKGQ